MATDSLKSKEQTFSAKVKYFLTLKAPSRIPVSPDH